MAMSDLVEAVQVSAYTVPTDAPEADGTLAWDETTLVLVEVSGGGSTGLGWTYGPAACATVAREQLTAVVGQQPISDVPGAHEAMVRAVRNSGRPGIAACAISAVDVALWDLKARWLGLPLLRLLGATRHEVPVYGSGGFTTYDAARLRDQLQGWVQQQAIPRVKIKIGESWGGRVERDVDRMDQARRAIGPGAELFVDANGGYGRKQAIRVMQQVTDLDVRWFEEPVSSDDLEGLHEVRDAVRPDVAAGEYAFDPFTFRRLCESGAVDCVQADVSRCGGITAWLRLAAVAAAYNLQLSGHCAPHLHAHVAAAVPNLRHLEWFHDHVRIESLFFDGVLDPQGGTVSPADDRPGLGLTFKAADAAAYRIG